MKKDFKARIIITAETHFPKYFAVKTTYFLSFQGREYVLKFWQHFLDGYDNAIILN